EPEAHHTGRRAADDGSRAPPCPRTGVPVTVRVGLGYDVHPFGGARPLVLAGGQLDGAGLAGHSGADAVAHAVADAVLGASGLPDLGTQFPASDDQNAGANSLDFLRSAAEQVAQQGWWVVNVDVVIAAERPALADHVSQMALNLAEALHA